MFHSNYDDVQMCSEAAKEAKFMGKGSMEDDVWRDVNKVSEEERKGRRLITPIIDHRRHQETLW